MSSLRCITTAAICLAASLVATEASPQALPHLYTLVDVGPASDIACPCIAAPFALPAYRPGYGYGDGAAAPATDAPPSADQTKRYAAERILIARDVENGHAGDGNASLSVGMHLAEHSTIAGADQKVEEETARWLHLAARQGNVDASVFLASRYIRGNGLKQSDASGAFWFHQAAVAGKNVAMVALGLLYATGRGVPQDSAAAIHWWEKAQRTMPLASRFLGDAYACGFGVPQDTARAVREYKKAADRGDVSSTIQLGHMYINACPMVDDEAAVRAFRDAADRGYPEAQVVLSDLIRQGRGQAANPDEAYLWARLAERRFPSGELHARAAAAAKAAAAFMSPPAIAATERMIDDMIATSAKSLR